MKPLLEISQLSHHDKVMMMEELWVALSKEAAGVPVPQWHRDLLDERAAKLESGEAGMMPWEEAKQQIEKRCQ